MRIKLAIPLYLNEISAAINTINLYHSNVAIEYLTTDSRKLKPGDLFIPLKGKNHDGESFVGDCLQRGGICLTRQKRDNCILIKNAEEALLSLAHYYKKKLTKLKYTVAITGSVGKTTTKEILKKICSNSYKTHATEDNKNNQLGLPITILSAPCDTELLILEMGMNHSGEISKLSKCSNPDIAIITKIGTAHIGNLGSRENIARAKLEILEGMKDGKLIIPYDEPLLKRVKNAYTFSVKSNRSDVYIYNNEGNLTIGINGICINTKTDFQGIASMECLCAAIASANLLGINPANTKNEISKISSNILRQSYISFDKFTVLADYFNASYESVISSLELLAELKGYKVKSALLGSIYELGDKSKEIHFNIGEYAAKLNLDHLFIISEYAKDIFCGALSGGMSKENIFVNEDIQDTKTTAKQIKTHSLNNEIILFKASHAVDLGRVIVDLQDLDSKEED